MIEINEAYRELYTTDKRYILITGGRGSLKSTTVHDFISRLTYERGHNVLFTRYTMKSAEKSIIPEFRRVLEINGSIGDFELYRDRALNRVTNCGVLFTGIKTSSGNQTGNLKSLSGITTWVLEEAEDFPDEREFDKIDDSVRDNGLQNRVILIMNPTTKEHWIYKRFIENTFTIKKIEGYDVKISTHPECCHIHTTYLIAKKYLSDSFLRKAEYNKEHNEKWYYHNYIGGWLEKPEGAIIENWEFGDFPDHLPHIWGLDFGFSQDPTALVKVATEGHNVYVEEHLYKTGLGSAELIELLKNIVPKGDLIIADSAEARLIEDIRRAGINIRAASKGRVRDSLADLCSKKLIVSKNSLNYEKELLNYIWNDKKSNTPIDKYNHLIDATRYAHDFLTRKPKITFS